MDPNDPTDWQSHFQQPPEDVVYLNNAGSSQIPLAVAEIGAKYLRFVCIPSRPCTALTSVFKCNTVSFRLHVPT